VRLCQRVCCTLLTEPQRSPPPPPPLPLIRDPQHDHSFRCQGKTISRVVRGTLLRDFADAVDEGATTVADAALCFRDHIRGVLDAPLQVFADDAKRRKRVLPVVAALLSNPKWWYNTAVIDPMQTAYAEKLLEDVRAAGVGGKLEELRKVAQDRLKDDLTIYSAIRLKESHKPGGSNNLSMFASHSNTTPRHATPRHATPRHATPRHETPRHATPRHATPRHATPRHTTPHHTTPRPTSATALAQHLAYDHARMTIHHHQGQRASASVVCL
jgi:hypothetical protein